MQTGSYLELALTIYAWQVSNRLAEMIVASGLIYLPLLFIVWQNWSQTARSQEAKSAAPVSLRRMEQDVIVLFFTIIFAFLPAVSVTAGDIYYKSPTDVPTRSPDQLLTYLIRPPIDGSSWVHKNTDPVVGCTSGIRQVSWSCLSLALTVSASLHTSVRLGLALNYATTQRPSTAG